MSTPVDADAPRTPPSKGPPRGGPRGRHVHRSRSTRSSNSGDDVSSFGGFPEPLTSCDLEGVARYMEQRNPQNIICMVGAGLSTAAGIPDFRSPGTGLYDNLQRYNLPRPEDVFDLEYFAKSPDAFYGLAKDLWPTGQTYRPTKAHYFLKLLEKKKRLRRCYTQNIDMLEQLAGLSQKRTIAAHGNFATAHALNGRKVPINEVREAVFSGVAACRELAATYGSLVKPDIVFFGEDLPKKFQRAYVNDFSKCDLLIVMGTSLGVAPFNKLIRRVPTSCPRVLVNREPAGLDGIDVDPDGPSHVLGGFRFGSRPYRDVFLQGDVDEAITRLCERLGWAAALKKVCTKNSGIAVAARRMRRRRRSDGKPRGGAGSSAGGSTRSSTGQAPLQRKRFARGFLTEYQGEEPVEVEVTKRRLHRKTTVAPCGRAEHRPMKQAKAM